jgi:MFS family permease
MIGLEFNVKLKINLFFSNKKSVMNSFTNRFWLLNIFQMLEKIAYWIVLLQLPIYISQKDIPGGLHWDQTIKGVIFFWWALVQNFSPILFGFLSDKFGSRKVFNYSLLIIIISYTAIGFSKSLFPFIASVILLGIGSAMFKPTLQSGLAKELNKNNQAKGWGIYFMLLNLAVFMASPLSKSLKEISWDYVFWGSALISVLNIILNLLLNKENNKNTDNTELSGSNQLIKNSVYLKETFRNLFQKDILIFIFSMSGFAIIYMQFYETLPNFLYDWTNTSAIAYYLPDFMLMKTPLGQMISYEWLYNINSGLILLFVVFISQLTSKIPILKALILGTLLATFGLLLCGISTYGSITILGMILYTFGEMITNPKFTQYLSEKSNNSNKGIYLSYLNISFGIGLSLGSLFGSWIYGAYGEKSTLSINYLADKFNITSVNPKEAFDKLIMVTNSNYLESISRLFNTYSPYLIWTPFVLIGIISTIGLFYLLKKSI